MKPDYKCKGSHVVMAAQWVDERLGPRTFKRLVGMSDRVSALGGRLQIDSPPGVGTRVTASLPLNGAE